MSQENVEVIREGFDAWNREDMDALLERTAPDVVVTPLRDWPEAEEYVGRDAYARQLKDMRDGLSTRSTGASGRATPTTTTNFA